MTYELPHLLYFLQWNYAGDYIGCFTDKMHDRVLPGIPCQGGSDKVCSSANMTVEKCISLCREVNDTEYVYAGVEFGKECYFGPFIAVDRPISFIFLSR